MEVREPKYNFALCFEAPIPSNSSNSNRGGSGWTFPSNNGNGGPQEGLPMLAPLDATPLNTSFPTPVFNTPPNSGLPPPYVQPRPTLGQNFLTPPNSGPPPPYVQPTLGRPLKTPPSLQTPPNHGLPPGSGDSERPLGSASSNSFLTPGSLPGSARRPPSISFSTTKSDSSSGTQSDSQSTPESVSSVQELGCVIAAVVEGRGLAKGEVGVASIDLKQPVLLLSQYPDTAMYVKTTTKLLTLRPIEILMPNTISDSISKTKLFQLVRDQFTESSLTTIQRKYFNETRGLEYVRQLCAPEFNSVQMDVSKKYYALAAAAALLKYVEFIQNIVFAPSSLKISYHGSEKTTLIDVMTAKNLELLSSSRDPASPYSLAAVINFTKTKGGARLLRSNILEPPCHLETILLRQECIQELTGSQEMFYGIGSVLKRFLNVDQLISMCVHMPKRDTNKTADRAITYVIYLKHTLELVPLLRQYLANATNPLLKAINEVLDDSRFEKILSLISTAVHDDTHYQRGALNMRTQKCFCIREGISGMLDITRKVHTEVIDDILLMTEQLADKFHLPIRSAYNTSRGFYLQLYTGEISTKKGRGRRGQRASAAAVGMTAEQLPSEFIKVTRLRNNLNFTTLDLLRLNNRANDSLDDIYRMTHIILKGLLDEIREHVGCLYRLSECVAMLDMLHSFAHSVTVSDYVCPEFSPDTLCIKAGRHPMLDKMIYNQPVPNNVYASSSSNLTIITGPNMSGKSTYLRQIALLQILAQMGCYVPAEYACFRIANQIFSRIGSDDDMEGNASAFMVELREMHYILQNIDSTGLVIIDELGRGTSVDEGMGYCFAFAERLLATNAFVFLATHFIEVTNLQALYPNVENYYFEMRSLVCEDYEGDAASSDRNMTHTHILTKGVTRTNHHYGLRLAELCLFPSSVVAHARQLVKTIKVKQALRQQPSIEARRSKLVRSLATTLVQVARNSQLDLTALRSYLKHLKTKYIRDMQRLSMEATLAGAMPSTEDTPTSADNSLQLSSTQQEQS